MDMRCAGRWLNAIMLRISRVKLKWLAGFAVALLLLLADYMGAFTHVRELDYKASFKYPLDEDVVALAAQLKRGEKTSTKPINNHAYVIKKNAKAKCVESDGIHYVKLRLVFVVKSAIDHFDQRSVIRKTWGYEKRFSDVAVRTVFLLGSDPDADPHGYSKKQEMIDREYAEFGDIVQGDFRDTYFNNTIKSMMGLRWVVEQCATSRFYFFVDDDFYVSLRNMLRFLRNPVDYPHYLEEPVMSFDEESANANKHRIGGRKLQQLVDFDLPEDVVLYAGHVFHTPPHRHKTSKWYVSLEEWPWDLWPPYVTAGAVVYSRDALIDMYYASYFVKPFRFDDIYMGIVAKKLNMEPFHCPEFYFDRKPYAVPTNYRYVVASHGFDDPSELERFWNKQKAAGNA